MIATRGFLLALTAVSLATATTLTTLTTSPMQTTPTTPTTMTQPTTQPTPTKSITQLTTTLSKASPSPGEESANNNTLDNNTLSISSSLSSFHHLIVIGVATLISCVCLLVVVAVVYLVVTARRPPAPEAFEFSAMTPTAVEVLVARMVTTSREALASTSREALASTSREPSTSKAADPDNGGYETPRQANDVDRLPMAPSTPGAKVEYMEVLEDVDVVVAAPESMHRVLSTRELPPIPTSDNVYEPVREVTDSQGAGFDPLDMKAPTGDARNSFDEFAKARAAKEAPPLPVKPSWKIG